jgi:hypothetical protein
VSLDPPTCYDFMLTGSFRTKVVAYQCFQWRVGEDCECGADCTD